MDHPFASMHIRPSSTVQSSGDMDLMVYIYGDRRKLGPRRPSHKVNDCRLTYLFCMRSTVYIT